MTTQPTNSQYANLYLEAAQKLGLATKILDPIGFIRISSGKHFHYIYKAVVDINSAISTTLCRNKHITSNLLQQHHLPCPTQILVSTPAQLKAQIHQLTYPVVIKPYNGIQGQDIYTNLPDYQSTLQLARKLLLKHKSIVIENHLQGDDYRLLVLDNQVIGIVKKSIPHITGDGTSTIRELITKHPKSVTIPIDDSLRSTLERSGYSLSDILPSGITTPIRSNANISTGGSVTTLTDDALHPSIVTLAISAARAVHTRLAGVDIILQNPQDPASNNAYVIEVNHNPGIKMHYYPDQGAIQPVAITILSALFNL